ncbi:MAG: hypothetical protein LBH66_02515 [Oscillospiraceae bacterium]|nr:hypothetical protein [Oscillospiraceae bacterium]
MFPAVALIALAATVSPRLLGMPDPSVEGAFALAAAVSSLLIGRDAPARGLVGALVVSFAPGLAAWLIHSASKRALWLCGGMVSAVCLIAARGVWAIGSDGRVGVEPSVVIAVGCAMMVVMSAIWIWLARSRMGLGIRAVGLGGDMARYQIVPASAAKIVVLAAGGLFAGAAGVLYAIAPNGSAAAAPSGMWVVGLAASGIGRVAGRFVKTAGLTDVVSAVVGSALWCALDAGVRAAFGRLA